MRKPLFAAALMLAAQSSFASYVYSEGPLRIDFSGEACNLPVMVELLKPVAKTPAKKARILFNGQLLKGCWAFAADGNLLVVDEQGDGGYIDFDRVKETGA